VYKEEKKNTRNAKKIDLEEYRSSTRRKKTKE
jgi:hypothetical protein